jgi:heat shock protein HslJ
MTDQDMQARLEAAGQRWRDAHPDVANADAGAATDDGFIPLDFGDRDDGRPPKRRGFGRRQWLAAAAAVVLVGGLAVGLVASRDGGRHTATPAGTPTPAILGTSWTLTNFTDSEGGHDPVGTATFAVDGQGQVQGTDGCNQFSGDASVTGGGPPDPKHGIAAGSIEFGSIGTTEMACPDLDIQGQQTAFAQLLTKGPANWIDYGGGKLALERGPVTLVFVARPVKPAAPVTDPAALAGTSWLLNEIDQGDTASSYATSAGREPTLRFGTDGKTLTGSDGCNGINAAVSIAEGSMTIVRGLETQMACPGTASEVVSPVLREQVSWQIVDGRLKITRGNIVLVFVSQSMDAPSTGLPDIDPGFTGGSPASSGSPSVTGAGVDGSPGSGPTSGSALVYTTWALDSVRHGNSVDMPSWVSADAAPKLQFYGQRTVKGTYGLCGTDQDWFAGLWSTSGDRLSVDFGTGDMAPKCDAGYAGTVHEVLTGKATTLFLNGDQLCLTSGDTALSYMRT